MGGAVLRPGIPMKLVDLNGTMKPQIYGLVDSGADISSFPLDWAKQLAIDPADLIEMDGDTAGGKTKNYYYPPGVDAIVMGKKIHLEAVFNAGLSVVLLGREDFFQLYKIAFHQRAKTFTLTPY
jgi:hypothetical protein